MARKLELTWVKAQARWKKFYKGKVYYFRFGNGKSDMEGYRAALAAWQAKKAELDDVAADDKLDTSGFEESKRKVYWDQIRQAMHWTRAFDGLRGTGDPDVMTKAIGDIDKMLATGDLPPVPTAAPQPVNNENGIDANAKRFLNVKRADVSRGRLEVLRASLNHFLDFIGRDQAVQAITSTSVEAFYVDQVAKVKSGKVSSSTGRDRLAAAKDFMRWLDFHDKIRLPKNLSRFNIAKTVREIKVVPVDDIKTILANAADMTRLYALLALNCGMQQKDIANLKIDQVNWKLGRIARKRIKTENHHNVPMVNYKLWPSTFTLLKDRRAKQGHLVLLNENGGPLMIEKDSDDGRYQKNDNITTAYARLCRKLGMTYPFKLLRKSASTMLAQHKEYGRYAQHFLGHAPSTLADAHYVRPSEEQFDVALQWLGVQFGQ